MKHLLFGLTEVEAIREVLIQAVATSPLTRKELAHQLSLRYPLDSWSERSISYILNDSVDIPLSKANQLMEFLFPDEKFSFNEDELNDKIDEMYERLSSLRRELRTSLKDDVIDTKELQLLKAQVNIIQTLFYKFLDYANKAVNLKIN